jgi:hypothetical protein
MTDQASKTIGPWVGKWSTILGASIVYLLAMVYSFLLVMSTATGTNFDAHCPLDPASSRFCMVPMAWFPNKTNSFKIT